jgi:glycosyltransferase involved in cell wall biosynthesis
MVKVLRVMGGLDVGGVETGVLNFLRLVDPSVIQTTVYCLQDRRQLEAEVRATGTQVVYQHHNGNPLRTMRLLERFLKDHPMDVVHCHNLFFAGWIMWAAHRADVPIRIAHANNTGDQRKNGLVQPLYHRIMRALIHRHATTRLAVSGEAAVYLFGDDPVEIVTSGIDTAPFHPEPPDPALRAELGISPTARVIGHVGNLRTQKNHHFLLEIAREMLQERPDLHFVLVGEGPLRSSLEERARNLGISSRVTFTGTRRDVPRLMARLFDLFLFPSLYEGMGQVIVQAQAAGLPVAATASLPRETHQVPDLVHWVDLDEPAAHWGKICLDLLDGPERDRANAHALVRASQFDLNHTVHRLTALYQGEALR